MPFEPFDDLRAVAPVHHKRNIVSVPAIDENIVPRAPVVVANDCVAHLPGLQTGDVSCNQAIDKTQGLLPAYQQTSHMADVEYSDRRPSGIVFLGDGFILDGHLPSGKWDQLSTGVTMKFE